ncbi:HNH endonuclease [Agreia sp. COWG]|uniref:HNH endonuclease n=1 Tax=Agreia sp. COWG TaxID=2773266 RepID=UPI001926CB39|nr:conserved protein of unknown function [Agreia sp. COWG]
MNELDLEYPPEAFSPDGSTLWWELEVWPGQPNRRYGAERKIAAWLAFNVEVGETFSMRDLRSAIGAGVPNDDEHLNRRLRRLRADGWDIPTTKDDASIGAGMYRLDALGWHPGAGERPPADSISDGDRRRVLERDGRRCVVCGIGAGEPYPNEPYTSAALTVGHRIPRALGGDSKDINNLQAECARCNEPVRHSLRSPETIDQLRPDVVNLSREDARKLLSWSVAGHRSRDRVDQIFDRVRQLSVAERMILVELLRSKSGTNR